MRWVVLWVAVGEAVVLLLAGLVWLRLRRRVRRLWHEARIGREPPVKGAPAGGQIAARHRRHVRLSNRRAVAGAVCVLCLVALFATGVTALLLWRGGSW